MSGNRQQVQQRRRLWRWQQGHLVQHATYPLYCVRSFVRSFCSTDDSTVVDVISNVFCFVVCEKYNNNNKWNIHTPTTTTTTKSTVRAREKERGKVFLVPFFVVVVVSFIISTGEIPNWVKALQKQHNLLSDPFCRTITHSEPDEKEWNTSTKRAEKNLWHVVHAAVPPPTGIDSRTWEEQNDNNSQQSSAAAWS